MDKIKHIGRKSRLIQIFHYQAAVSAQTDAAWAMYQWKSGDPCRSESGLECRCHPPESRSQCSQPVQCRAVPGWNGPARPPRQPIFSARAALFRTLPAQNPLFAHAASTQRPTRLYCVRRVHQLVRVVAFQSFAVWRSILPGNFCFHGVLQLN